MVTISTSIRSALAVVVVAVVLLAMTPVVIDQVEAINTTGWNFTGSDGAIAILGLVPFLWIAGILTFASVSMFQIAKSKEK